MSVEMLLERAKKFEREGYIMAAIDAYLKAAEKAVEMASHGSTWRRFYLRLAELAKQKAEELIALKKDLSSRIIALHLRMIRTMERALGLKTGKGMRFREIIDLFSSKYYVSPSMKKLFLSLNTLRNKVVHENHVPSPDDIEMAKKAVSAVESITHTK